MAAQPAWVTAARRGRSGGSSGKEPPSGQRSARGARAPGATIRWGNCAQDCGGASRSSTPVTRTRSRRSQPAQLEVVFLQPHGRPVVPALPVEHAFGAPGVEDTEAARGGEGTETTDSGILDDTGTGEHDDRAQGGDLTERVIVEPVRRAGWALHWAIRRRCGKIEVQLDLQTGAARRLLNGGRQTEQRGGVAHFDVLAAQCPNRAVGTAPRNHERAVTEVSDGARAADRTVRLGQEHRHQRIGDRGDLEPRQSAAVQGSHAARRQHPPQDIGGGVPSHRCHPTTTRPLSSPGVRGAARRVLAFRRTPAVPPPGRGDPTSKRALWRLPCRSR